MCALYSSSVSSSNSSSHKAFAAATFKPSSSTSPSLHLTNTQSPSACSARAKKMKSKAPVLVVQQQQQPQQPQQPSLLHTLPPQQRLLPNHSTQRHHSAPVQPGRTTHVRRNSGNAGQKHQHFHQQQQQQQHSVHHRFDHVPCPLQYPQQSYRQTHNHPSDFHSSKGLQRSGEDKILQSTTSPLTPVASETEDATAATTAAAPAQDAVLSSYLARKQSGPSINSASGVLSSAPAVTQTVSAARRSDAQNSDPEPVLGDVEHYIHKQQLFLQANRRHQDKGPSKRLHLAAETNCSLGPLGLDSDMSSTSSLREGSEFETDDDKGILGGSSDSNDTDSLLGDAVELDRRSRRKRSMQRLVAKNKMLKSSLLQAKADLAAEKHSRAMLDQIYLKIKKELNSKLEAEEVKVAHLKADLEQMTQEMNELKEKSTPRTSYKIGYDSSPYSLSSGLGGLMLHHSNLIDSQDDSDEFIMTSRRNSASTTTTTTTTTCNAKAELSTEASLTSPPESLDEEEEHILPPIGWRANESKETPNPAEDDCVSVVDESPKKLAFLSTSANTLTRTLSPRPAAKADLNEDSDTDNSEDEAPCTMMEILIKKQHSQSPEDDIQDPPADVNETFDSMAHKFLHQALHAKFTPARTILQLDDLLLKYDAVLDNLVLVLAQEFMKWWEHERSQAGGPAIGGWGTGTVLIPETGVRVSAKVAVESKFKAIYVPLLLNYVASHQEQMLLLEKLEQNAKTNARLMRNHLAQLMALYKFDVLEADAILEWWKLLKEPEGVFGHGDGLRSMSSKFVAWLEDEEEDSDEDEDEESDDDEDEQEDESDCEDEIDCGLEAGVEGLGKILGLELLTPSRPGDVLKSLDEVLAKNEAEQEELMVIGSDDENAMDDQMSTTSSLERIEECERKRRISFCTNNVYINQDGRVQVNKAPAVDRQKSALTQCPPMREESEEEEDLQDDELEDNIEHQ
ncbi:hypothetical protein BGZ70_008247 [Mortierella alpina]|uniref:W2 domain-containing protein n=1 Tax=Mortierella alpina TaxID=64518 RepID=A0A9P6M1R6_MORAP|nr:hypothetical protein BGZ70_008247 [Mortierella alpina]